MATLAVRSLRIRDLAQLGSVNEVIDRLDGPLCQFRVPDQLTSRVKAVLPRRANGDRAFAATIDGELCAYLVAHLEPRHFQWELGQIAAGSPRLETTYDVCVELWTALIGYAVKQAGMVGAKRVFASALDDSPAFESLRANGFEPYEDQYVLVQERPWEQTMTMLPHVRPQSDSDVWSVHQLYHHVTPKGVQFAEALTSSEWESKRESWFNRAMMGGNQATSYVLDTGEGVAGHCRIERKGGCAIATIMLNPEYAKQVDAFLYTCMSQAGLGKNVRFKVEVPGYFLEHLGVLEKAGFTVSWERCRLVKHTTASVVIRPRLVPVHAVEERERAVQGVPTLFQ